MVATKKDIERKQRIGLLEELVAAYEDKDKRGELTGRDAGKYREVMVELLRLRRVEKCRWDLMEFSLEYLSEERGSNPDFYLMKNDTPSPEFHYDLAKMIMETKDAEGPARLAVAAPREHAKSALLVQANLLHSICYELTKYTILISAMRPTVVKFIKFIKDCLKYNDKIRADFGEIMSTTPQRNIQDREDGFITLSNITVEAFGADSPIRGQRAGVTRPDLIMDDLEDKQSASSRDAIRKMVDWFDSDLMPIGDSRHSKYFYGGTILAYDSLLHQILRRGSWRTYVWKAVIRDSVRQDLWSRYHDIYIDPANQNRGEDAYKFYLANEEEMESGVVVLWPEKRTYLQLMNIKYDNPLAFQTEQMNDPIDKNSQMFDPERFSYYQEFDGEFIYDHGNQIPISKCLLIGGIDLARAKETSDYTALGVIAKSESGAMYILACDMYKLSMTASLKRAVEFIVRYKPSKFIVESVGYQGEFAVQLKEELQRQSIYHTVVEEFKRAGKGKKEVLIAELQPIVDNGFIRFHPSHYLLLDQFAKFKPTGSTVNDDGPDVTQMIVGFLKQNGNTGILDFYRMLNEKKEV